MRFFSLLLPVVSAAIGYALAYAASVSYFGMSILRHAVYIDFLLVLAASYLLFFLSRQIWAFIILQWLVIAVFYIGNAAKLSFFGGPMMPDNVYAVKSLILILDGLQRFLVVGSLASLVGLLIFNFHFRSRSAWLTLCFVFFLSTGFKFYDEPVVADLDYRFGNSIWNQRENYLRRGATLYSLQETARFFKDIEQAPGLEQVRTSADLLLDKKIPVGISDPSPRNVHFILL